MEIEEANSI